MDFATLPKVDGHTHLFYDRDFLVPMLHELNMQALVINIIAEGHFQEPVSRRWKAMKTLKEQYPDAFMLCTTINPHLIHNRYDARNTVRTLKQHIADGAEFVKVWKDFGLEAQDPDGSYVQVDDPRYQPIWDYLAEQSIPVIAHIAEPRAAWEPLDPSSPHYGYYSRHPEFHFYQDDTVPHWDELIAARDRWIENNPELTIIGAHFGSMSHEVELVADRLDRYPNFFVDTAERFGDLVAQPSEKVREFMSTYHDRIVYGTDVIIDREPTSPGGADEEETSYRNLLREHWNYMTNTGERALKLKFEEPVTTPCLDLPETAVADIYQNTFSRLRPQ